MINKTTLPSSWLALKLGDVVNYGATIKAEPADIAADTWVLELEDVEKDTSRVLQHLTFAERQSKSTKNQFEAGDVLYGKLRPYLNKIIYATKPGVCTTEIVPLKANDAVDGRYLFHWVRHPVFFNYVTEVSHGVNMPRLGTDSFWRLKQNNAASPTKSTPYWPASMPYKPASPASRPCSNASASPSSPPPLRAG